LQEQRCGGLAQREAVVPAKGENGALEVDDLRWRNDEAVATQ